MNPKKMIVLMIMFFNSPLFAQHKADTPTSYKKAWEMQKIKMAEQNELSKAQAVKAKEQEELMNTVKRELIKDGLLSEKQHYTLIINKRQMMIDGKLLPVQTHEKYIKLIYEIRKKDFGDKEEWKISN